MGRPQDLQREREELETKLKGLAAEQRRVAWGSVVAVAAIPVGMVWGGLAALAALAGTVCIIGVALYIIHGHRYEYENRLRNIEDELKKPTSS